MGRKVKKLQALGQALWKRTADSTAPSELSRQESNELSRPFDEMLDRMPKGSGEQAGSGPGDAQDA